MYRIRYIGTCKMYRTMYRSVPKCTEMYRMTPPLVYRNVPNVSIDTFRFGTKRGSVHPYFGQGSGCGLESFKAWT
jgi:hypothetical protein